VHYLFGDVVEFSLGPVVIDSKTEGGGESYVKTVIFSFYTSQVCLVSFPLPLSPIYNA